MIISERIKKLRKQNGLNQAELAEHIGVSPMTERRWEWGQRSPRAEELAKLAAALHTTVGYLMGIEEPAPEGSGAEKPEGAAAAPDKRPAPPHQEIVSNVRFIKTVKVPLYSSIIKACCGEGNGYDSDMELEVEGTLDIPASELEAYSWQVGPRGFGTIRVEGDSMEPRIHDGEIILFGDLQLSNGNFALVRYDDRFIVRGVWNDRNGHFTLRALNPAYKDIDVDTEDESKSFYIYGKVIRVISMRSVADGMM